MEGRHYLCQLAPHGHASARHFAAEDKEKMIGRQTQRASLGQLGDRAHHSCNNIKHFSEIGFHIIFLVLEESTYVNLNVFD